METHLGERVIKEEEFAQNRKPSLKGVSGGRNRAGGERTKTQIMPVTAATNQEVAQMLLSTIMQWGLGGRPGLYQIHYG